MCALMWRTPTKHRLRLYNPEPDYKPLWGQGVTISHLFTNPPLPSRLQGNLQFDITSRTSNIPELTIDEIVSTAPLSALALYTRAMTESVTRSMLDTSLLAASNVSNKSALSIRVDSFPQLSLLWADWRAGAYVSLDFGFGKMEAYRHLFGGVPVCQAVVYPERVGPRGEDEGMEIMFSCEREISRDVVEDGEWREYMEFRGVDEYGEGEEDAEGVRAKL
jgi:hypothetical protein